MLLLTIGVISALFIISYLMFDRDLLAPPTVVAMVFLFGCLCALYNENTWELEFSLKSMGLIASGIIATMLGGVIGVFLSNAQKGGTFSFSHEVIEAHVIQVGAVKTWIVIAFQLVTILLLYMHIQRLTGSSNLMLAIAKYRLMTGRLADANDLSIRMPMLTRNMVQFSRMIAVIYAYIVGNNLIAIKNRVSKIVSLDWLPVLLYTATTFLQGDRSNMLRLWVVALVTAYVIHRRTVGWRNSRETRKVIRNIAVSIVGIGVFFVAVREIVGRTSDKDPFAYVTFYAGSPVAVLNQMWESPIVKPEVFGQRTFFYLNQSTTALFGWPGRYNFYYDFFYSPNGTSIGNAPTAFRPAYVEFGFWGFFLFLMLCGVFYMLLYCGCREKKGSNPIDFNLLIYGFVAYVFFMYFYSTFFDFLSHLFIKYIIELLIIRWALVGWQFRAKLRIKIR